MRGLKTFLFCWVTSLSAQATHIIGGELYYTWIGADDYLVTLKIYRDCGPNNTNQTGFDATSVVAAYAADGSLYTTTVLVFGFQDMVPVILGDTSLTPPEWSCVEVGIYSDTMHLPSGTGGYTLSYQRCCRSGAVLNLFEGATQGMTCTVNVPDVAVSGPNSSPHFSNDSALLFCVSEPMIFSNAAIDADGDAFTYELCAPLMGGGTFDPQPSPPLGPPFAPVNWAGGYSPDP